METVIRFIGVMLIVQLQAGGPFHAIIPKWENTDNFCGVAIMPHAAYVRVAVGNNQVHDDATWTEKKDCDKGQDCRLYSIPVESNLTINTQFTPMAPATKQNLPCFVPHLKKEGLVKDDKLHKDALKTLSIVNMEIPPGELLAPQFPTNDMIYVTEKLVPPPGTTPQEITVTATPRVGGNPRKLVLAPGTLIDLIDIPPDYAGGDLSVEITDPHMEGHSFFLSKLLVNHNSNCLPIPGTSPPGCKPRVRNHKPGPTTTLNLGCGPSGP